MIGIGVTSYKRPAILKLWWEQYNKYPARSSDDQVKIFVAEDHPRKGIAYRKNECLRNLYDCEHIFLFDDDCHPIKDGWAEFYIEAAQRNEQQHLLYLKEIGIIRKIQDGEIEVFDNCGGVMMYMTNEVLHRVGSFDTSFGIYGFEHADYSLRCHRAEMCGNPYQSPKGAGDYLRALDWDNPERVPFMSSMSEEIDKIPNYITEAERVFSQNRRAIKIKLF